MKFIWEVTSVFCVHASLYSATFDKLHNCNHPPAALFKLTVDSVLGYIPATASPPSAGKQTGGEKKGMSPVIWAVPVAVVGLILVLVMTYFVRKSRRLERSMFALMTRRTIDDEGGVTFHSGTDRRTLQCI